MTRPQRKPPISRRVTHTLALVCCFSFTFAADGAFAQATPTDQIYYSGDPPTSTAKEPQIDCSYLPNDVRSEAEKQGACDTSGGIVPTGQVITARMNLDCTNMTDEARAEADKRGACDSGE